MATVTVPGGRAIRDIDVLRELFVASNAALGLRVCSGDIRASSRFYNNASDCNPGSFGMYVPAVGSEQALLGFETGYFQHLSYSPVTTVGFRTNIGFVNACGVAVDVVITLFGDLGERLGELRATLQSYEHRQYTRIHPELGTAEVTGGFATVEVLTPGGSVHSYLTLIDNESGDPSSRPSRGGRNRKSSRGTSLRPWRRAEWESLPRSVGVARQPCRSGPRDRAASTHLRQLWGAAQ